MQSAQASALLQVKGAKPGETAAIPGVPTVCQREAAYLRSAAPLDPARPVILPGEREQAHAAAAAAAPISVDGPTWTALAAAGMKHGIDLPKAANG